MPLMLTQLASDNFQRADVNPLSSPWVIDIAGNFGLKIVSDLCLSAINTAGIRGLQLYNFSLPNDQYASFTVAALPGPSQYSITVAIRSTDDGSNPPPGYRLSITNNSWLLARSNFVLAGGGFGFTVNVGDVFTLAVVGTTLYVLQNGTQLGSVTDASFSSGGSYLEIVNSTGIQPAVSNFAIGSASTAVLPNFIRAQRKYFPSTGLPGDLWYDTDTQALFLAVADPNEFLPGQTDSQNTTNLHRVGLLVTRGLRAAMPAVLPVGAIFLTTDSFDAFAGTGVGVQQFRLDVRRALRGVDDPTVVPVGSTTPTTIYFIPLEL